MQITQQKLDESLKQLDGKPLAVSKVHPQTGFPVDSEEVWTLRRAITNALNGNYDDEKIDGAEKSKRGLLAFDIHGTQHAVDLSAEDVALIKQLAGKAYGPLMVAQIWRMIDPPAEQAKAAAQEGEGNA
jgi:hypothetical protein